MRFGFHISIAGGFSKVVGRARKKGCETIQLFSRNPRGWRYNPIVPDDAEKFRNDVKASGINPVFVHMPYLPNLASSKPELYLRSIESLCEDLERSEFLGAPFLIIHVGSWLEATEEEAVERVAEGVNQAFDKVSNNVVLLLENTAGEGTEIGYRFSQIKAIIDEVEDKHRIGVCFDTAHAFEAEYDLSTEGGLDAALDEFDDLIGLGRLHLVHLNDSKTVLGSHSDRHWHIGEGYIGLEGFRNIVNNPRLRHLPGIMETPRKNDAEDLKNMSVIRSLDRTRRGEET